MIGKVRVILKTSTLRVPIERADGSGREGWHRIEYPSVWWHHEELEPERTMLRHPDGRQVMISVLIEADGHPWLHVSLSRRSRLPSYADLTDTKRAFVGADRKAIQVFPAEAEHVNCHPYCLHLWCRLDGDSLPDFSRGVGMV